MLPCLVSGSQRVAEGARAAEQSEVDWRQLAGSWEEEEEEAEGKPAELSQPVQQMTCR